MFHERNEYEYFHAVHLSLLFLDAHVEVDVTAILKNNLNRCRSINLTTSLEERRLNASI